MPVNLERLHSLSRFFFAGFAVELQTAYDGFAQAPIVDDWSAVEFSFNRLFVGPRTLQAPPYASIYLDGDETRLMGNSTERVRNMYALIGLESPWLNKIPDDHIGLELDALWQMESALQHVDSEPFRDLSRHLYIHLRAWVPQFIFRVRAAENVHPAILFVAKELEDALSLAEYTPALKNAV